MYAQHIQKSFGSDSTAVIFDGYPDRPSTKDYAHLKRCKGVTGPLGAFYGRYGMQQQKQLFLSKKSNEQTFINLLGINLQANGCTVIHAEEDADRLIVGVTVQPPHDCYSWWHVYWFCSYTMHQLHLRVCSCRIAEGWLPRNMDLFWTSYKYERTLEKMFAGTFSSPMLS